MTKRDWWGDEIAFYIKGGIDPDKARIVTILRWMWHGDFRPLAAAIWERQIPEEALTLLAQMIEEGRLKLAHAKRHRPKSPAAQARKIAAARLYQDALSAGYSSDEAFEKLAAALGMSEQNVRQAVTAWRKSKAK
jgi:hypothetical protein